jgi:MFS family permease
MIAAVVRTMKEPQRPGAVRALALLLALNTLCYLDRHILAALEPEIRHGFFAPDDPDAMAKTGALATAFLVSYMILAPLFGWLADKHSRWAIIGSGAAVWSLATAGSGWAPTFGILLAARILVGAGEPALWAGGDVAFGFVSTSSIRFGSCLVLRSDSVRQCRWLPFGGAMAGAFGWRAPFHFAAVLGLVLAGLCLLVKRLAACREGKASRHD